MLMKIYVFLSQSTWLLGIAFMVGLALWGMRQRDKHHQEAKRKWDDAVAKKMNEPASLHPEIDPTLCGMDVYRGHHPHHLVPDF